MGNANEFSFGARLPLQQSEPMPWSLLAAVGVAIINKFQVRFKAYR